MMLKPPMSRPEHRPALAAGRAWIELALVLAIAGLGWACSASVGESRPATAAAAGAGWWWFTDNAFQPPSPEEQEWLRDIAEGERSGDPLGPSVEIEKPSARQVSCPFDVAIHFRPGRDPTDPARLVPIDLKSVRVVAEKLDGLFHGMTKDLTQRMEPFSEGGFSRSGVEVPGGKYRVSIELKDELGRTARTQTDFSIAR